MTIPVIWAWQFTDWKTERLFEQNAGVIPEFQEDSRIFDNRILLRKDKAITVNKSRLVFRGMEGNRIRLDLYLLELDPDYAYPHYISEVASRGPFRLGDTQFQLLDISRGVLQLRIVDLFRS